MPTARELRDLARLRLREAEALYAAGLYDGAAYLCGYSVEFALKARICTLLGLTDYPPPGELKRAYAIHDCDQLRLLAGLKNTMTLGSPRLLSNWSVATRWKVEDRYNPKGSVPQKDARDILDAVGSKPDGILSWIAKRW